MNPNAVEPVNLGVVGDQSSPVTSEESVNPLHALEEAVKNATVQTQQEPLKDSLTQFAEFAGVPAPVPTGVELQSVETPAPASDTVLAGVKPPIETDLQPEVSVAAPILDPFAQKSPVDSSTLANLTLSSEVVPQFEKTPEEELKEKFSDLLSEYTIEKTKEKAAV